MIYKIFFNYTLYFHAFNNWFLRNYYTRDFVYIYTKDFLKHCGSYVDETRTLSLSCMHAKLQQTKPNRQQYTPQKNIIKYNIRISHQKEEEVKDTYWRNSSKILKDR